MAERRPAPCPQCGRTPERLEGEAAKAFPFCSLRCADLDLGKWFDGTYTVPVIEEDGSAVADDPPEAAND